MWSTAASWVALLALTAALTRYYNPELFNKLTGQSHTKSDAKDVAQKPAAKRQKTKRLHTSRLDSTNSGTSTPTSATEGKAIKRRKLVSSPVDDTVVAQTAQGDHVSLPRDEDGGMSNKEFAQQLAKAQTGTKLEGSHSQGPNRKERRAAQSRQQGKQPDLGVSGPSQDESSAAEHDADHDTAPAGSPATGSVSTGPAARAGDVTDMLEAPAAKPTTLRLTDVKESKTKNALKSVQKAFEPVLSKKQRQRQAKAAEQKAMREEADRVHEAKKQQQLRTARLAEGTSNQTKASSFAAKQNAWQAGPTKSPAPVHEQPRTGPAPLLDTFDAGATGASKPSVHEAVTSDPQPDATTSTPEAATTNAGQRAGDEHKAIGPPASNMDKASRPALQAQPSWADEVNEEEQDRWVSELAQEEKWESVTSKKGKKKGRKDNDTSSEASSTFARPPAPVSKPVTNGSKENGANPRRENVNRFQYIEPVTDPSFQDAEWEA
ncbi:hypothetical protein KCU88_g2990, partial [Aureobasidium melanogenum]